MPLYTVNRDRFTHDRKHIARGGSVEMTQAQAQPLVALGALLISADDAQGFTPTETGQGVVEVEQSNTGTAPASPKPARKAKAK